MGFDTQVSRNNKGIALEKAGDVDGAVRLYELNVKEGFEGSYPYERLRVIYSARKDYTNALRACEAFIAISEQPEKTDRFAAHAEKLRGKTMLQMSCPSCGQSLQIPAQYAGQQGRCKHCNSTITVPGVAKTLKKAEPKPAASPPPPPFRGAPMGAMDPYANIDPDNYVRGLAQAPEAQALPRASGYTTQQKTLMACAGCLIIPVALLVFFSALGAIAGPSASTPSRASAGAVPRIRSIAPSQVVTLAEFNSLSTGMTYAQAVDVIGAEGTIMSENTLPDFSDGQIRTVMYVWQNTGGANMNAMFQNDSLMSKSQFGLR